MAIDGDLKVSVFMKLFNQLLQVWNRIKINFRRPSSWYYSYGNFYITSRESVHYVSDDALFKKIHIVSHLHVYRKCVYLCTFVLDDHCIHQRSTQTFHSIIYILISEQHTGRNFPCYITKKLRTCKNCRMLGESLLNMKMTAIYWYHVNWSWFLFFINFMISLSGTKKYSFDEIKGWSLCGQVYVDFIYLNKRQVYTVIEFFFFFTCHAVIWCKTYGSGW